VSAEEANGEIHQKDWIGSDTGGVTVGSWESAVVEVPLCQVEPSW
jgi:hypothetical protein